MRTPQTAGAVCWDLRLAAHFAALVRYVLAMPSHDDASKSFLQSCTEALQNELPDNGITITSPMPGPTARNQGRNQSDDDPDMIAKQGFEALMKGKHDRRRRNGDEGPGCSRQGVARLRQGRYAPLDGRSRIGRRVSP